MRVTSIIAASLGAAVLVVAGSGPSLAGEINGTGNPPGGEGLGTLHAHSICAFSGLEDGDGAGFPGPGGAPPQNWGHVHRDSGPRVPPRLRSGVGESSPATPATVTPASSPGAAGSRSRTDRTENPGPALLEGRSGAQPLT